MYLDLFCRGQKLFLQDFLGFCQPYYLHAISLDSYSHRRFAKKKKYQPLRGSGIFGVTSECVARMY